MSCTKETLMHGANRIAGAGTRASRLRWGILSTARIARERFIPGVRAGTEGEVVAIASREAGRAQQVAAQLQIPRAYGSYEELLADPEVEAVYIALPNSLHVEWTIRAAQAGKHVLCEKPLARRAADAVQAAEACRQAGVLLMEAFMYRLHPQHARALRLLADGAIGTSRLLRASFCFAMSPQRRAAGDIRLSRPLEGGALMDVGCYTVNAARFLFGAEPVAVTAQMYVDPAFGVDTGFVATLAFPEGRLAVVDASFDVAGPQRYEVAGDRGCIVVEPAFVPGSGPVQLAIVTGGERRVEEVPGADQYALEADHFARCVRAGRLLPPAEDGVAQAKVIEALFQSAETGQLVRLT
jgi:xylose dehydrogenase (NAD/NADP)